MRIAAVISAAFSDSIITPQRGPLDALSPLVLITLPTARLVWFGRRHRNGRLVWAEADG
jgi:hypothetical protein